MRKNWGDQPDDQDNKGVPIIRKRGATYEPSILVKIDARVREDRRAPGSVKYPKDETRHRLHELEQS